jgi:hypothetical protein
MTFKECYELAVQRADEDITDLDDVIKGVIKNGVNDGYMLVARYLDKTTEDYPTSFDKVITLPAECGDIDRVTHDVLGPFSVLDYKVKNDKLYMNTIGIDSGDITITYIKYPPRLVKDTDNLAIRDSYCTLPAIYGAYQYMLYRKKYSAAQLLLQEFNAYFPQQAQVKK